MKLRLARLTKAAALITALTVSGLAANSQPTHAASRTLHISWFNFSPAAVLQTLANQYAKEHPEAGVQFVIDTPPNTQWASSVFTPFAAHKTAFVAAVADSQWLGQLVTDQDVPELTSWLKKNLNTSDFDPSLFASYSQYPQRNPGQTGGLDLANGHFYGIPWFADAKLFAYRKDLWADPANQKAFMAKYHYALAVPKSMDQIVDMADFFTNPSKGFYGYATHEQASYDSAAETFLPWCWNYGGDIWNSQTGAVEGYVNSPRCVHALTVLDHLTQKDSPPGSGSNFIAEVTTDMNQGKVAMAESWLCCNSGYFDPKASTLGKTAAEIGQKVGFFNYPGQTYQGKTSRFAPLGGQGLVLSKYAPQADQDAMLAFAKWFFTTPIQREWYKGGATPAVKSILASADFKAAQPWNPQTSVVFNIVKDFWNMPEYSTMLNVLNNTINQSMTGGISPKDALDLIAKRQSAILRQTGRYSAYK